MATKYPPALFFSQSINVIRDMHQQHGMETAMTLMPKIFGITESSSYLPRKTSALQAYGLAQKTADDNLALTELAMKIIKPIGDEGNEAKLEAFKKVDILSDLLIKYPDGKLASPDQLQQVLMKSYSIPRETVKMWYDFIVDAFREISTIVSENTSIEEPVSGTQRVINRTRAAVSNYSNFDLPSGGRFEFGFPAKLTAEDLDFIIGFLELKKKSVK